MTNETTAPDLIERLRYPINGMRPTLTDGRAAADALEAAHARIAELERENAIIRAAKAGVTYVCPECDIAGCKHVRAALEGKG